MKSAPTSERICDPNGQARRTIHGVMVNEQIAINKTIYCRGYLEVLETALIPICP